MFILPVEDIRENHRHQVGGKGFALARLYARNLNVPKAVCLTAAAYHAFLETTGLDKKILLEIHRKSLDDARWEEMWDAALRIRNLFLRAKLPRHLARAFREGIDYYFQNTPVAVRSSALGEDSAQVSFAGIHDSYVNITGTDAILKHIKLVWASLWSDAAILYRKELRLEMGKSAMPVVIQEFVSGDCSGVFFGKNPMDDAQSVVEAVYGLNQGLVDGTVEPDRWILRRRDGKVLSHTPVVHSKVIRPSRNGVRLVKIDPKKSKVAPLSEKRIRTVFNLGKKVEESFGLPQDVEWTFRKRTLYTLQSRPITTDRKDQSKDEKSWYLSLRRSFANLQELRIRIEESTIPAMIHESDKMAQLDLSGLSNKELAGEIQRRKKILAFWMDVYWKEFIPFAHGFRLFGQVYNDKIHPEDPYEFVELLRPQSMHSLERNRMLHDMATLIKRDKNLAKKMRDDKLEDVHNPQFQKLLKMFLGEYANLQIFDELDSEPLKGLSGLLLELAEASPDKQKKKLPVAQKPIDSKYFLSKFKKEDQDYARGLLDLGKFSYRLRDDDNIYLGKIERQMSRTILEGRKRLRPRFPSRYLKVSDEQIIKSLEDPKYEPILENQKSPQTQRPEWQARQLKGQPAGKGLATGDARVISGEADLFELKKGEILVCDAVDPNMTFVVPLAGGIVERRGGMLIHGAIIAREYGIPCVTGIADATELIQTGDSVTVDGFLGLVIIEHREK
jgi:phosphoenolpyruvate synthase/pyruvate phosphate dikinase